MSKTAGRPLRADAERSVRAILAAAERVLAENPAASMEQVAEAAGVTRTTVHRRFDNRQALLDALAAEAAAKLAEAIEDGHPETAPPLLALHRATANVLRVKGAWSFALGPAAGQSEQAARIHEAIAHRCTGLLGRLRDEGAIAPDADLEWVRRVLYALISEVLHCGDAGHGRPGPDPDAGTDPDTLATRIVDTLLRGVGPRPS
ncbi:helix-turn-helix domain-containing protein [Streptomyces sp. NPDC089919]|uniref:TetR/AcrR family transcriptional regulator n=1 Tax=Streptomyces sp. NPDC089919 TaxID=3155188 RepID=UPI003431A722